MGRRSKDELAIELRKLSAAVDACYRVLEKIEPGAGWTDLDEGTLDWFNRLIETRKATMSECIGGARDALNDVAPRGSRYPSEAEREARFLRLFEEETGESFWAICPKPSAQLKIVRTRGRIVDETEARLVQDRLSDVGEKSGPGAKERSQLEAILGSFENEKRE